MSYPWDGSKYSGISSAWKTRRWRVFSKESHGSGERGLIPGPIVRSD